MKQAITGRMDKRATPSLSDRTLPTVSVVIPVYRSEQTLPELYRQLSAAMAKLRQPSRSSSLKTEAAMDHGRSLRPGTQGRRVRGIGMSRNYGQHNALLCGIRAARYDLVLTMDDDLQHPVSEIAPMLAALSPNMTSSMALRERNSTACFATSPRA